MSNIYLTKGSKILKLHQNDVPASMVEFSTIKLFSMQSCAALQVVKRKHGSPT